MTGVKRARAAALGAVLACACAEPLGQSAPRLDAGDAAVEDAVAAAAEVAAPEDRDAPVADTRPSELPDAAPPGDARGTPAVSDPGGGVADDAAGYFRLAVEAWGPHLSFPDDRRTLIDVYYGSGREVFSNALGGKLMRVEVVGNAAVYRAPFGDLLELVLEPAQVDPYRFTTAYLRERGQFGGMAEQFPYPGIFNRVAEPPFRGGPSMAPVGPLVPRFFASAAGTVMLRCTAKDVPVGADGTWRRDGLYPLTVRADGTLELGTERGPYARAFDETRDTHVWPADNGTTAITLNDRGAVVTVIARAASGALQVTRTISGGGVFAIYTLAP